MRSASIWQPVHRGARGGELGDVAGDEVAGRRLDQDEGDDREDEQQHRQEQQPLDDVDEHRLAAPQAGAPAEARRRSPPPRPSPIEGEGARLAPPAAAALPPPLRGGSGWGVRPGPRRTSATPFRPGRPRRHRPTTRRSTAPGRVLPGVRSGQSLPAVSGTLRSFWLTTITPWTIGVRPTVPISQTFSVQILNSSWASSTWRSGPRPWPRR